MKAITTALTTLFFITGYSQTDSATAKLKDPHNNDPYPSFVGSNIRTIEPVKPLKADSSEKAQAMDLKISNPALYERKLFLNQVKPSK